MLSLTSSPVKFTCSKALHLIHPRDAHNPVVQAEIQAVTTKNSFYVARAGETMMTANTFNQYTAVIVHSCTPSLLKDYLKKLQAWQERLDACAHAENKQVLLYSNAITIASEKVFIIPKTSNVFVNDYARSQGIDVDTEGLGLTKFVFDVDFNPKTAGKQYKSCISYFSHKFPIYLLDSRTVVSNNGEIRFGKLYRAQDGTIETLQKADEFLRKDEAEAANKRRIKPIHAIYKDDVEKTSPQAQTPQEGERKDSEKGISDTSAEVMLAKTMMTNTNE